MLTKVDRNQVLFYAIGAAKASNTIWMLAQFHASKNWQVVRYPHSNEEWINNSIRYVLPNGEVTKLS